MKPKDTRILRDEVTFCKKDMNEQAEISFRVGYEKGVRAKCRAEKELVKEVLQTVNNENFELMCQLEGKNAELAELKQEIDKYFETEPWMVKEDWKSLEDRLGDKSG